MAKILIKQFAAKVADFGLKDGDSLTVEQHSKMFTYIPLLDSAQDLPDLIKKALDIPDDPTQFTTYQLNYKRILLALQQYGEWLGYGTSWKAGTTNVNLIGYHMEQLWPKVTQMVFMGYVEGERVRAGAERVGHVTPANLEDWAEWKRCWTEDLKREGEPPFFYPCTTSQDPSPMEDYRKIQLGEEQRREFDRVRNSPEHKADLERIEAQKLEKARLVQERKDVGLETALEQWAKIVTENLPPHVTRFATQVKPSEWDKHWTKQDPLDGLTNGTRSTILSGEGTQYQLDRDAFGDDFTRGLQLIVWSVVKPILEKELLRRNPLPLPPEKDKGEPDAVR